jgi:hypothetical protein
MFNDMKDDIDDKATKSEFEIIAEANDRIEREIGKFCTKGELMMRFDVFINENQMKLADRPTIGFFRKTMMDYDAKLNAIVEM